MVTTARIARQAVVSGRVQGVYYRASTQQQARRLAVAGWVRNRPDGSVEAWLEGAPDAVEALLAWMRRGPAGARVTDITVTETLPRNDADFVVTE
ncbi:MAG: acylphosphatase [Alcanivorax sp.]|nr:acylphosphatase [Alcanivorax sp.]MEC8880286.1 acylphosphatase [Pseudomonadota bacterium]MED5603072.1 acylphosphatase [Pseudomonadota bacterium]HBM22029.1 acylphosphatase [Alcanivorax sp.]HCJ64282.1 acylphosphatase [Alcanivorax sp.]